MSKRIRVAILGATGHVGKNLIYYFSQESEYELVLFSRDQQKMKKIIDNIFLKCCFKGENYDKFNEYKYDVILNCIGTSDPIKVSQMGYDDFKILEYYDNKILDYLKTNNTTFYLNLSSGSVYGQNFSAPVNDSTLSVLDINKQQLGQYYSIMKIYSEAKHRSLKNFNIVDMRIFGFFSRFIDLKSKFFLAQVISSIKNKKVFLTNDIDFLRDFIHPRDLFMFVNNCIKNGSVNDAFDLYSKAPVSKFEILRSVSERYGLKYEINKDINFDFPTGIKENYYSISRKAARMGYESTCTSLETIIDEAKFILKPKL